jgi:hypothetical protein
VDEGSPDLDEPADVARRGAAPRQLAPGELLEGGGRVGLAVLLREGEQALEDAVAVLEVLPCGAAMLSFVDVTCLNLTLSYYCAEGCMVE